MKTNNVKRKLNLSNLKKLAPAIIGAGMLLGSLSACNSGGGSSDSSAPSPIANMQINVQEQVAIGYSQSGGVTKVDNLSPDAIVTVTSSDTNIALVSTSPITSPITTSTCQMTSDQCTFYVYGVESGLAKIITSANGYATSSTTVWVRAPWFSSAANASVAANTGALNITNGTAGTVSILYDTEKLISPGQTQSISMGKSASASVETTLNSSETSINSLNINQYPTGSKYAGYLGLSSIGYTQTNATLTCHFMGTNGESTRYLTAANPAEEFCDVNQTINLILR